MNCWTRSKGSPAFWKESLDGKHYLVHLPDKQRHRMSEKDPRLQLIKALRVPTSASAGGSAAIGVSGGPSAPSRTVRRTGQDECMSSSEVLASAQELDAADLDMIHAAEHVIDTATDSGPGEAGVHTVGAAVRGADGMIHAAINLYHFTGGPCAEIVALATARAAGVQSLERIVAVRRFGGGVIGPCGRCRQVLADYHPGIRVVIPDAGRLVSVVVEDLLPLPFYRQG